MCKSSEHKIQWFLKQFKFIGQNLGQFTIIPRDKNLHDIAELGITPRQVKEIILGLTEENYCEGPLEDHDLPNHNVWIFGYDYEGQDVYIKLSDDFSCNVAKCISFHQANRRLNYPYKT